jgi:hypothetical protein
MSRSKDLQRVLHYYRQQTGKKDVDMHEVAKFAVECLHMTLPKPVEPMERLARGEQMVGDAWQLSNDAEHWNASHADEEPIQLVLDFTADVEERRALSEMDDAAG